MDIERRSIASELADIGIEERSSGLSGIKGYGAVYYDGTPATEFKFGKIVERVMPGAFSSSLDAGKDVVALFNHDTNLLLGRRSAKTLRLFNDDRGLRYSVDTPNTSYGRDLIEMISRGDVRGSSFSFMVNGAAGESWRSEGDAMIRELRSVNLLDVSPVVNPAYEGTSVDLRSAFKRWDEARINGEIIDIEFLINTRSSWPPAKMDLARRRLRLMELQSGLR